MASKTGFLPARFAIGTYEHTVSGVELEENKNIEDGTNEMKISKLFRIEAHLSSVTCLASSPSSHLVASGSSDETIRLFDIAQLKDFSALYGHTGEITCLEFFGEDYLLSGSGDGAIIIWSRNPTWEEAGKIAAHKGGVLSLSIHPTGKLALSVGKDGYLKLWNLMTCSLAHKIKLRHLSSQVKWSRDGKSYYIVSQKEIKVYDSHGDLISNLNLGSKILAIVPLGSAGQRLAVGCENGAVTLWNSDGTLKLRMEVRRDAEPASTVLVSGSSDGEIIVWNTKTGEVITKGSGNGRITCMSSSLECSVQESLHGKKRKTRKNNISEENETKIQKNPADSQVKKSSSSSSSSLKKRKGKIHLNNKSISKKGKRKKMAKVATRS